MFVDHDGSARIDFNARFFKCQRFSVRTAASRQKHRVPFQPNFFLGGTVFIDHGAAVNLGHIHMRLKLHAFLFQNALHGCGNIPVFARQYLGPFFEHRDLRTKRGKH